MSPGVVDEASCTEGVGCVVSTTMRSSGEEVATAGSSGGAGGAGDT